MYFRIYCKPTQKSRFKALNLSKGTFVINLIYATLIEPNKIEEVLAELRTHNPEMIFEARKTN